MTPGSGGDLGGFSIWELFRMEVEEKSSLLTEGLLALEGDRDTPAQLELLMRAAHSLKGAAGMVDAPLAVQVSHAMEDCFVAAQRGELTISPAAVDVLLAGTDLLQGIASDAGDATDARAAEVQAFLARMQELAAHPPAADESFATPLAADSADAPEEPAPSSPAPTAPGGGDGGAVQVSPERMSRLLALAAESLVASRRMDDLVGRLTAIRQLHRDAATVAERLRETLPGTVGAGALEERILDLQRHHLALRAGLETAFAELEGVHRRKSTLAEELYHEIVDARMRPFSDIASRLPRLVRTLARQTGKEVALEIRGDDTPVDREILGRVKTPLVHLIRNAVDHGVEPPAERRGLGKRTRATIRLEARHHAGLLLISLEDDGRGIDLQSLRRKVVERRFATEEDAARMGSAELLEFLFLPGFTLKEAVTEISGRGVGLDVVQSMAREVGGTVSIGVQPGEGARFELRLPLTLSVARALIAQVGGEPYAFPLARVDRVAMVRRTEIESVEGRLHVALDGRRLGLVSAAQVFDLQPIDDTSDELPVVVLGERSAPFGLIVERLLGERELVVRPLDPRLGKIKDISAAALMPDLSPVLIADVDDVLRTIEHLVAGGRLAALPRGTQVAEAERPKRVLVVDDSFTVRELERKLLVSRGYAVEVAGDGMDGWNALRTGDYDLVITDVDMPRMDGFELVRRIREDPMLRLLPVIIVSYKDREEDRLRGLDVGADRYLGKGSYHDESMLTAVAELIGEAPSG